MFGKRGAELSYEIGVVVAVNSNSTLDVLIPGRAHPYKELPSLIDPRIHRVGIKVVVGKAYGSPYMPFVLGDMRSYKKKVPSDFVPTFVEPDEIAMWQRTFKSALRKNRIKTAPVPQFDGSPAEQEFFSAESANKVPLRFIRADDTSIWIAQRQDTDLSIEPGSKNFALRRIIEGDTSWSEDIDSRIDYFGEELSYLTLIGVDEDPPIWLQSKTGTMFSSFNYTNHIRWIEDGAEIWQKNWDPEVEGNPYDDPFEASFNLGDDYIFQLSTKMTDSFSIEDLLLHKINPVDGEILATHTLPRSYSINTGLIDAQDSTVSAVNENRINIGSAFTCGRPTILDMPTPLPLPANTTATRMQGYIGIQDNDGEDDHVLIIPNYTNASFMHCWDALGNSGNGQEIWNIHNENIDEYETYHILAGVERDTDNPPRIIFSAEVVTSVEYPVYNQHDPDALADLNTWVATRASESLVYWGHNEYSWMTPANYTIIADTIINETGTLRFLPDPYNYAVAPDWQYFNDVTISSDPKSDIVGLFSVDLTNLIEACHPGEDTDEHRIINSVKWSLGTANALTGELLSSVRLEDVAPYSTPRKNTSKRLRVGDPEIWLKITEKAAGSPSPTLAALKPTLASDELDGNTLTLAIVKIPVHAQIESSPGVWDEYTWPLYGQPDAYVIWLVDGSNLLGSGPAGLVDDAYEATYYSWLWIYQTELIETYDGYPPDFNLTIAAVDAITETIVFPPFFNILGVEGSNPNGSANYIELGHGIPTPVTYPIAMNPYAVAFNFNTWEFLWRTQIGTGVQYNFFQSEAWWKGANPIIMKEAVGEVDEDVDDISTVTIQARGRGSSSVGNNKNLFAVLNMETGEIIRQATGSPTQNALTSGIVPCLGSLFYFPESDKKLYRRQ